MDNDVELEMFIMLKGPEVVHHSAGIKVSAKGNLNNIDMLNAIDWSSKHTGQLAMLQACFLLFVISNIKVLLSDVYGLQDTQKMMPVRDAEMLRSEPTSSV